MVDVDGNFYATKRGVEEATKALDSGGSASLLIRGVEKPIWLSGITHEKFLVIGTSKDGVRYHVSHSAVAAILAS